MASTGRYMRRACSCVPTICNRIVQNYRPVCSASFIVQQQLRASTSASVNAAKATQMKEKENVDHMVHGGLLYLFLVLISPQKVDLRQRIVQYT